MYFRHILLLLGLASYASATPLNINLGAYSPALVVGDGEISFGGNEAASGEAATGATTETTTAATNQATAAALTETKIGATDTEASTAQTSTEQQDTTSNAQGSMQLMGMGKQRLPKE